MRGEAESLLSPNTQDRGVPEGGSVQLCLKSSLSIKGRIHSKINPSKPSKAPLLARHHRTHSHWFSFAVADSVLKRSESTNTWRPLSLSPCGARPDNPPVLSFFPSFFLFLFFKLFKGRRRRGRRGGRCRRNTGSTRLGGLEITLWLTGGCVFVWHKHTLTLIVQCKG